MNLSLGSSLKNAKRVEKLLKHSKKGFLNIKEKFKRKNIAICPFYKPFLKTQGHRKAEIKRRENNTNTNQKRC